MDSVEVNKFKISEIWNISKNLNFSLKEKLKNAENIAIYGAGNLGKQVLEILQENNYKINCFFDKNAVIEQKYCDLPVYRANDSKVTAEFRKNVIVILAIFLTKKEKHTIRQFLLQQGYQKISIEYSLLPESFCANDGNNDSEELENIEKAFALMADKHSQEIFTSNLYAHGTYSYDQALVSKDMEQYFDVQVPWHKGYSCFVDCGAFTGDSLEKLLKYHKCATYIGFEADRTNFVELSKKVDELETEIDSAYLYPCAVGNKSYYAKFKGGNGSVSILSDTGEEVVQVVTLDDVLKTKATMIKMDIEGAEIAALHGAKNLIIKEKPDLAICVYHHVSDLWIIPLLLHEWVSEYKFYLRCHANNTIETVLYATLATS